MCIGAGGLRQTVAFGIPRRPFVVNIFVIASVIRLHGIDLVRQQLQIRHIMCDPERVRMDNAAALAADHPEIVERLERHRFRMRKQPFRGKAIGQEIVSLPCVFPAEAHAQADLLPCRLCMFKAFAELPHPFLPRQIAVHRRIAVPEMIGDDHPVIACRSA